MRIHPDIGLTITLLQLVCHSVTSLQLSHERGTLFAIRTKKTCSHAKKSSTCCNIVENRIEQCCAVTVVSSIVQHFTPDLGSTILFNVVDNCEQCGLHNFVQSCYTAGSEFLGV